MKTYLSLFFSLFLSTSIFAQFGITAGAQWINAPEWEKAVQEKYNGIPVNADFAPSIYLGADYWFRLKNKRIEFTPEIAFTQYQLKNAVSDVFGNSEEIDRIQFFNLYLNTNFYLLDFAGDCNCPTFSKDGDVIKKGLFLRIAPGISWLNQQVEFNISDFNTSSSALFEAGELAFSIRGGIGLDIGISDLVTVTPLLMGTYFLPTPWRGISHSKENLDNFRDLATTEDQPIQLFAGIRLGFRFDEMNKYGYR